MCRRYQQSPNLTRDDGPLVPWKILKRSYYIGPTVFAEGSLDDGTKFTSQTNEKNHVLLIK